MDIINKVESYRNYSIESRYVTDQFEADKLLFKKWATSVGIVDGKLGGMHHADLDADTVFMVEKILWSVQEIFSTTEVTISHFNPGPDDGHKSSGNNPRFSQGCIKNPKSHTSTSRRHKFEWTLIGKTRFIMQVQHFGALVNKLYSLVPPKAINTDCGINSAVAPGISLNGIYS
jgi:hypothetical protein